MIIVFQNHYEAYLERVIPTWRQNPSPLRTGRSYLPYRDMEWSKYGQVIPEEDSEQSPFYPFFSTRAEKHYQNASDFPTQCLESEKIRQPIASSDFSKNLQSQTFPKSINTGNYEDVSRFQTVGRVEHFDGYSCSEDNQKGLETALHRKLILGNRSRSVLNDEGMLTETPGYYQSLDKYVQSRAVSPNLKEDNRPMMTEKPVEMKKPEYIVGKLHPEATSRFEYFGQIPEKSSDGDGARVSPPYDGDSKILETAPVNIVSQPSPQAKWNLLKHKKTIDKLKESLTVEEELDNIESNKPTCDRTPSPQETKDAGDDIPFEGLQESHQISSQNIVPEVRVTPESISNQSPLDVTPRNYEQEGEEQKAEEVFEDNEESYPESYYEQPPKPEYSRNLVSNVILEEDECEIIANEEVNIKPDVAPSAVTGSYEQTYEINALQENNKFNMYNTEYKRDITEVGGNEDQYQNVQSAAYAGGEMYCAESQGEYLYQNQEATEYDPRSAYVNTEETTENQEYYDVQQGDNYNSEGQGEYDGQYQGQNFDGNQPFEQYGENISYPQEYTQEQEAEYYNQEGYHDGYYQIQQGEEYPVDEQQQQEQDMGYSESSGIENVQQENASPAEASNLPLRQSNLSQLLESDSETFQIEHGSIGGNDDSDFDFTISQQQ